MAIGVSVGLLAVGGLVPGLVRTAGGRLAAGGAAAAGKYLAERLSDSSRRGPDALARAAETAWATLGKAFDPGPAGLLDRADVAALAGEIRGAVSTHAEANGWADPAAFLVKCRKEYKAAGPAAPTLDGDAAARQLADWLRFADPAGLAGLHRRLTAAVADDLRDAGFVHLSAAVGVPHPADPHGTPVLAAAVAYFVRREIEADATLFPGLALAGLDAIQRGLDRLERKLDAAADPAGDALLLVPADVADPAELCHFRAHASAVTAVACSPDGAFAASAGADGTVRVFDIALRKVVREIDLVGPAGVAVAVAGGRVVLATADGWVRGWDVATGKQTLSLGDVFRGGVAMTPSGTRAVCGSLYDGRLRDFDLAKAVETRRLTGHSDRVTACGIAADGSRAVTVGTDGRVKLWDLAAGRAVRDRVFGPGVTGVALPTAGRPVLLAAGRAVRFDLTHGETIDLGPAAGVAAWNAVVLLAGPDGVRAVCHQSGRQLHAFAPPAAVAAGGAGVVAAGSADGTVRVFAAG